MATRKLYYEDSHRKTFSSQVISCTREEGRYRVILDATAFYPEGGGQAADTGKLGGVRVLDTREAGEDIVHFCDGVLEPGSVVTGEIDYESRFIRMQQHSGEHILSGLVFRKYGYHNSGFHMNLKQMQVDFDGPIPAEDLPELEKAANRAVWEDIPIHCWIPAPEELGAIVYRTKRALPWPVRIVEIPGYDTCACCGTHVGRTGEIGIIKIFSAAPFRGGTRLEMACGIPAYQALWDVFDENRRVSRCLSVPMLQTGEGARKLTEQLEAAKFRIVGLEREKFDTLAESFRGRGDTVYFSETDDGGSLRELASRIGKACGGRAAVFGKGSYCLYWESGDVRPLAKALNQAFGGKGGGKSECCQGRLEASEADLRAFLEKV